jgi:hypothetical protein
VTPEERIKPQEFNATHQRTQNNAVCTEILGAAIGEFEVFQEQIDCHQLPPVEEICQFCHAVKWKDETSKRKNCFCTVT